MAGSPDDVLKWHYDAWIGLRGSRIVLRARQLSRIYVEHASGRHKSQKIVGTDNAEAWLEIPLRPVAEGKR